METTAQKKDIIQQLQKDILSMQGHKAMSDNGRFESGLGPIESSFPNHVFPIGAIHEFLSDFPEDAAASNAFISAMLGRLARDNGTCLWIGSKRTIFPPALMLFGLEPDRIVFVDVKKEKDVLWATEEALKCASLSAVVGELSNLTFMESRRLQLAVEESRVTGFIHRHKPKSIDNLACVSRWKIRPLPSIETDGLPGVGRPCWNVELLKARNGTPGNWGMEWSSNRLKQIMAKPISVPKIKILKAV
jgi:protein ImuA